MSINFQAQSQHGHTSQYFTPPSSQYYTPSTTLGSSTYQLSTNIISQRHECASAQSTDSETETTSVADTISNIKLSIPVTRFVTAPNLPKYSEDVQDCSTTISYNSLELETFVNKINAIYEQSKYWQRNIFSLPRGANAKKFIDLLSYWLDQFNKNTPFVKIALKVFMVLPNILCQKPSKFSKPTDHQRVLGQRLAMWEEGQLDELVKDCRLIQRRLTSSPRTKEDNAKLFVRFMIHGKVNSALRLLEETNSNGILPMNKENLEVLKQKHPLPSPSVVGSLLFGPVLEIERTYFDTIDADMIDRAMWMTKGAAGPSNMDSQFFRELCHKSFKKESNVLKQHIAALARKLATENINPEHLESYVACRLVPLDKNPGLRPIGIGETLRRIIGKVVSWVFKDDVMNTVGPLQVAAGMKSGSESAIHAIKEMFDEGDDGDAVILVDASNAFNSMNRGVARAYIMFESSARKSQLI